MGYIGQAEDEWEAKQKKLEKKKKRALLQSCPVCAKKCKNAIQHAKDVHGVKIIPAPKFVIMKGDCNGDT